jgi:broad specificity phosphatase PhoE
MAFLYLVRHGQASFGTDHYDRLSSTGRHQARLAARYLQRATASNPVRIVSGTLERQRDTATQIAQALSAERAIDVCVQLDARLNELDTDLQVVRLTPELHEADMDMAGKLAQARSSSRSYQKLLRRTFLQWQTLTTAPPELETWAAFSTRVASSLKDLMTAGESGGSTVAVTSGGVIATLTQQVLRLPDPAAYEFFEVMMNCSITRFLHDRERISLSSFNECSYLLSDENGAPAPQLLTYR